MPKAENESTNKESNDWDIKKFSFDKVNIYAILFFFEIVIFLWKGKSFNYNEKVNNVYLLEVVILNIILILIKRLHSVYIAMYSKNPIRYDINIINMYVRIIKYLVIIFGIIAIFICLNMFIK